APVGMMARVSFPASTERMTSSCPSRSDLNPNLRRKVRRRVVIPMSAMVSFSSNQRAERAARILQDLLRVSGEMQGAPRRVPTEEKTLDFGGGHQETGRQAGRARGSSPDVWYLPQAEPR